MLSVAIIIPFYQRTSGILRRTIESVIAQRLSPALLVTIIIVDDDSPVPVEPEIAGLTFPAQMVPKTIRQSNGGVAKARNTGLALVDPSVRYIAFLDSDDIWNADHLSQGIAALESGADFYFCDHSRAGHHQSHFETCRTLHTFNLTQKNPSNITLLFWLTKEEAMTAILRDFVCQASCTIFRRSIDPGLSFYEEQRNAGEDMLYFLALASKANQVCLSKKQMVHCGSGINIYYSNLAWDAEGFLRRLVERRQSHLMIQCKFELSPDNAHWNDHLIKSIQMDIAFHCLRQFVRGRGKWPAEFHSLAKREPGFRRWFCIAVVQVVLCTPMRLYRPK